MKIISMPRGAGKTTELIKMAADYNGCIVCYGVENARHIANVAKNLGIKINYPLTFYEFVTENISEGGYNVSANS